MEKEEKILSLYQTLIEDKRIIAPLTGPIHYFIYQNKIEEKELEESVNKNIEEINIYLTYQDSEAVLNSIDIIKKEYPMLYGLRQEIYDSIRRKAYKKNNIYKSFTKMQNDNTICAPLKKIISLYLSENLSEQEIEKSVSMEMNNLKYEKDKDIYDSVDKIKTEYPILYEMNQKNLDKIRRTSFETTKKDQKKIIKPKNTNSEENDVKTYKPIKPIPKNNDTIKKLIKGLAVVAVLLIVFNLGKWYSSSNNLDEGKTLSEATGQSYSDDFDYKYEVSEEEYGDYEDDFYDSETRGQSPIPSISATNTQNYLEYNYPDDFEVYEADGYSFGYPKNFYNHSEQMAYGYKLYADNGSTFEINVMPRYDSSITVEEEFENRYANILNRLYEPETIINKYDEQRDCKRFIVNGFTDEDITAAVYYLCNIYEDKIEVYELSTVLKGYTLEERNHANYILDTVYRLCSFSGTSYQPRTYTQVMNDDLGDKK